MLHKSRQKEKTHVESRAFAACAQALNLERDECYCMWLDFYMPETLEKALKQIEKLRYVKTKLAYLIRRVRSHRNRARQYLGLVRELQLLQSHAC